MLIDSREISNATTIEADLCIIGAGAAGITIAREFAGRNQSVVVLESGGFDFDQETQGLYDGRCVGRFLQNHQTYLTASRLRYFGGSTNHWEGWCRPLDDMDFEERSWVPHSGWPFKKTELNPYHQRAADLCQIRPFDYRPEDVDSPGRPIFEFGDKFETKIYHLSPPTHFGELYREDLVTAENIRVLLHANVVDIITDRQASRTLMVETACLNGNRFWVSARTFILATGAVENARLLLFSNSVQATGLGNQNDLVGRYFLEHMSEIVGSVCLTKPDASMALYDDVTLDPWIGNVSHGALCPTESNQRENGLLNMATLLLPMPKSEVWGWLEAVGDLASRIDYVAGEKRPANAPYFAWAYVRGEQSPNPASRVTLSDERDALGKPRVQLDWRLSPLDYDSWRKSIESLAKEIGQRGLGRVALRTKFIDEPLPDVRIANHSMGTTRMHRDPKQGVVDANCKVHGISNLFIAGSSVFPISGFANPTFTIVSLALRLADHMKEVLAA